MTSSEDVSLGMGLPMTDLGSDLQEFGAVKCTFGRLNPCEAVILL
jgi:hypothetical protein